MVPPFRQSQSLVCPVDFSKHTLSVAMRTFPKSLEDCIANKQEARKARKARNAWCVQRHLKRYSHLCPKILGIPIEYRVSSIEYRV